MAASSVAASSVAASSVMTDDVKTAEELLLAMGDYTPAIPEEVTAHFLAQSGFQATDERLVRLVSLATHKFVADLTNDALQHCKNRQAARKGDVRLVLTTEDLAQACRENGISLRKPPYYADTPAGSS